MARSGRNPAEQASRARRRRALRERQDRARDREGREAPHRVEVAPVAQRGLGLQVEARLLREGLGEVVEDRRAGMLAAPGRVRPRALHERDVSDPRMERGRSLRRAAGVVHEPPLPQSRRALLPHDLRARGLEGAPRRHPLRRRLVRDVPPRQRQGGRLLPGQPPPRRVRRHAVPEGRRQRARGRGTQALRRIVPRGSGLLAPVRNLPRRVACRRGEGRAARHRRGREALGRLQDRHASGPRRGRQGAP